MNLIQAFKKKPPAQYFHECRSDKIIFPIRTYGETYDMAFSTLLFKLQRPLKILEIGVSHFGEGSGHAFEKMPYVERYVGIDINPLKVPFSNERSVLIQENAYSKEGFHGAKEYAPFDLIIDDSTHKVPDQLNFFRKYKTLTAEISIMICEDVGLENLVKMLSILKDEKMHAVIVPYYKNVYRENDGHLLLRIDDGNSRRISDEVIHW